MTLHRRRAWSHVHHIIEASVRTTLLPMKCILGENW
ncbi:hypothetical protein V3C99_017955 [Haemonchus contortus]|uniref:Uncharacterized protein n=1 Tax=Haemonchus contortus TaxID=6289 RepID=A0A7I4Z6B2_HAECO